MVRTAAVSLCLLTGCYSGVGGAPADETDDAGGTDSGVADGSDGSDDDGTDDGPEAALPFPGGLRRLSHAQLENGYRHVLQVAELELGDSLPVDPSTDEDFRFDSERVALAPFGASDVDKLDRTALATTTALFGDAELTPLPCTPQSADDSCAQDYVKAMLRRAFRRPATADELAAYVGLALETESNLGDTQRGLEFATATALQSPWFVYQVEYGEGDGESRPLTDHELASRLAFFLWNAPPDEELSALADAGELAGNKALRKQVQRMLGDTRAEANMVRFFTQWFGYGSIELLPKNSGVFPDFSPALASSMRAELDQAVLAVIRGADYTTLFTTKDAWVDERLADFYGLEYPGGGGGGTTELEHWEAEDDGPGCNADGIPPEFHNLCSETATLTRTADIQSAGAHRISVRAYATQGGDELTRMGVNVDGESVLDVEVAAGAASPAVYEVELDLEVGAHTITISLLNDFYEPPDNRDLIVDWIQLDALGAGSTEAIQVELPKERRGLLTRAGILSVYAKPIDTSPTTRGLFVRTRLLCEEVQDPPPDVPTDLPPTSADAPTNRDRVAVHMSEPACRACHVSIDPLGLPLEHFDGIGAYRKDQDGHELDVTGELDGTEFDGAIEMGQVLADDPRVLHCAVVQLSRFALGQEETADQEPALEEIGLAFEETRDWRAMVEAFVLSDLFRTVGPPRSE